MTGRPELVSRFDLEIAPGSDPEQVAAQVTAALQGRAEVWTAATYDHYTGEMLAGSVLAFSLCGLGAQVVGLFLLYNVFSVSITERRRELGVLRAMGATRGQLRGVFLVEACVLGLVGVGMGIPLGWALAQSALGPMQKVVSDVFFPMPDVSLRLRPGTILSAVVAGLGTTLLAAWIPVLQAGAVTPVETFRLGTSRNGWGPLVLQVLGSLLLLVLGSVIISVRTHLPAQAGAGGGLLLVVLGVMLLIPLLAHLLARALQVLLRPWLPITLRLGLDNLLRAPGRTGLVISAVACGVALLLQTAVMISSHEAGIREWVDYSIAGDLFITAGGPLSASGRAVPMQESLGAEIRQTLPGAITVPLRFRYLPYQGQGRKGRILLVSLDADVYCAANQQRQPPLPYLQQYLALRDQPGTALVSENFAELYQVTVGQTIFLPGTSGPVGLRVIGIVTDYSCNRGTIVVDRRHWKAELNLDLVDVFSTYLPPGTPRGPAQEKAQQSEWAASHAVVVLPREELRGHVLSMVERLFGLAYAQELVLAIVAVIGVVTALLISVLQRRRELGLLRAVGATRGQVLRSVVAEAALMGLFGVLLGILCGIPLNWYALRIILFEETGFVFPLRFPFLAVTTVALITLTSTALAGLGPGWQAVREEVSAGIAYE
jgi:putative ABC transport system permease protein